MSFLLENQTDKGGNRISKNFFFLIKVFLRKKCQNQIDALFFFLEKEFLCPDIAA